MNNEETETYPLDEEAIEELADIETQVRALSVARMVILNYFAKRHKLTPGWDLAPNGKELVKTGVPREETK